MDKLIKFSLVKQSVINSTPITIDPVTTRDGVKSLQLGPMSFIQPCETCHLTNGCHGHIGKTPLPVPIFKSAFKKSLEIFLRLVCPLCGMIKVPKFVKLLEEIEKNGNVIGPAEYKARDEILAELKNHNKQSKIKCENSNCRISTSAIQYTKANTFVFNSGTKNTLSSENLHSYLSNLPDNFLKLITPRNAHSCITPAETFFVDNLLIASNYVRPPNIYEDNIADPFTADLNFLVKNINGTSAGKKTQNIFDTLDNNQGTNPYSNNKKLNLSILTSGTNKDSYLRNFINGKRVPGTARAVISPGIKIKIGYIGVPDLVMLKHKDTIFYNNVTKNYILKQLATDNKDPNTQFTVYIKNCENEMNLYKIVTMSDNHNIIAPKLGDMFERNRQPGGFIGYGRQPSIHQWNSLASEIIAEPKNPRDGSTASDLTINLCPNACPAMNADFDGDESLLITKANACVNVEMGLLMNTKAQFKHPCTGTTMYGFVQEQIVASNLLLHEKNISRKQAYLIFGEYAYLLSDDKDTYTGRELIASIFPDHFTLKGIMINGVLILDNILNSMVASNTYNSIFNGLAQVYNPAYALIVLDVFKTIVQNYLSYYGFSIKITDIIPNTNILDDFKILVRKYITDVNNILFKFRDDLENNKISIASESEFIDLKTKNIEIMNSKLKSRLLEVIKTEYTKENNIFMTCYNMNYKLSLNDIMTLLVCGGQKINKSMPTMKIHGKSGLYSYTNDIGIESSGFVANSLVSGLTFSEMTFVIKEESLPQIVNVTSGTSQSGFIGRKMVRINSDLFINNDKFMTNNKHIISFNPYFLKISMADMCKVEFVLPNSAFIWNGEIKQLFDEKLLKFIIHKKFDNSLDVVKEVDFYINFYAEMLIYYFRKKKENAKIIVNSTENLKLIKSFYNLIYEKYYFALNDISYVLYILLTYLDPSGFIFRLEAPDIGSYIGKELLEHIFQKITILLKHSLSSGTQIGYQIANTLQERLTQQSLSSFHTTTKSGNKVEKRATEEFKQHIELTKRNKEDIVACYAYDIEVLEEIKTQFEYICLENICLKNGILELDDVTKNCLYQLNISIDILNQKKIDLATLYNMIVKYCTRCFSIQDFFLQIVLPKKKTDKILKVLLKAQLKTLVKVNQKGQTKNVNYPLILIAIYVLTSFYDGIHKGKQINTNLSIDTLVSNYLEPNTDPSKTDNYVIKTKKLYELKMFVESLSDFKNIDTEKLETIHFPPWLCYSFGGMEFMKLSTIGKTMNLIGDLSFVHSIKHFFDYRFASYKPLNLKMLYDKSEIIKNANYGNGNAITEAAFQNQTDVCNDIYSSLLISQRPKIGHGHHTMMIDLNKYDVLNKVEHITPFINDDEEIIPML